MKKDIQSIIIEPYYFTDSMGLSRVGTQVRYILNGRYALARFWDVISNKEAARLMLMNLP